MAEAEAEEILGQAFRAESGGEARDCLMAGIEVVEEASVEVGAVEEEATEWDHEHAICIETRYDLDEGTNIPHGQICA